MNPSKDKPDTQGCASGVKTRKQRSILQFMSVSSTDVSLNVPIETVSVPKSPNNPTNSHKNNHYKQQHINLYFTPSIIVQSASAPSTPKKAYTRRQHITSVPVNLNDTHLVPELNESQAQPPPPSTHPPVWHQTSLSQFFNAIPSNPPMPLNCPPAPKAKFRNVRQAVLSYHRSTRQPQNKITQFTVSIPTYDLFNYWGHSLDTIDANHTFRIFLQNPNGLSIYRNNHFLRHDLQTCFNYGAAVLCYPETNTNWDQPHQLSTLRSLFYSIWSIFADFTYPRPHSI